MYPPAVPEVATPCTRRERHPHCPPHPWTSRKITPDLHGQPEEEQWLHLARSPLARPRDTICDSPHSRTAMKRARPIQRRSEEHTSELQSRGQLVCRLLLEKKKPTRASTASETRARDRSHVSSP